MSIAVIDKSRCCGCEACVQICPHCAITMQEDSEGFRYPVVNNDLCVECGLCDGVCQVKAIPLGYTENKYVFGGYHRNQKVRFDSTSGGAFSAIVDTFCDSNYVIFGAEADGLKVFHSYIENKEELSKFRKSKYSQSIIGDSYKQVKAFLARGKKVVFSGTPCQIAGLRCFLKDTNQDDLLTVEVICEGVPSPLYVRKWEEHLKKRYGHKIDDIDYRYTGKALFQKGKWDFQQTKIRMGSGKNIILDRWINPFWSIWLNHLMSRPSCYKCQFTTSVRYADITLGDLWGVHIYCPELYGENGGASLIVCNTDKGKEAVLKASDSLTGHELEFETALKYQSPMRKCISENPDRNAFIKDLQSDMTYEAINRKWAGRPSLKLLWQKYVWGNRQKVFFWKLMNQKYK